MLSPQLQTYGCDDESSTKSTEEQNLRNIKRTPPLKIEGLEARTELLINNW